MEIFKNKLIYLILFVIALALTIWFAIPKSKEVAITYRIAFDETWSHLQLFGKEGNLSGFTEDLLKAIAKEEKLSVQIISTRPEELFISLRKGIEEGILSSLVVDGNHHEKFYYSNPYFLLGPVLIVPFSSSISSIDEMKGKTLGILDRSNVDFAIEKYSDINFELYQSEDVFKLLEDVGNGIVDGTLLDIVPAHIYTSDVYRGYLKIVTPPLTTEGIRLVVRNQPSAKKLVHAFNAGLKTAKETKIYDDLLLKWELFNPNQIENKP